MREVQILKNVAYAYDGAAPISDLKDINTLAPGAIAGFTAGGVFLTMADAATILNQISAESHVFFAVGGADGAKLTELLPVDSVRVFTAHTVNRAGIAQVVELDDVSADSSSLDGAVDTRSQVGLKVYKEGNGTFPPDAPDYISVAVTPADTMETVIDKLIAAYDGTKVVLTKSGTSHAAKLVVTSADLYSTISVIPTDLWSDNQFITNTTTTAASYPVNTASQILEMEKEFSTEKGNTNQVYQSELWWKYLFVTDASTSYETLDLSFVKVAPNAIFAQPGTNHSCVFAYDETAAAGNGKEKIELFFNTVYGTTIA